MNKEKFIRRTYFLIGVFVFVYVLLRSILVGVTYDEVWTINGFVAESVIHILNYTPCDANNHILNTLLIKLLFLLGNHSLLVARLPNLFAFALYLYFSYKISYKYLSPLVGLCCYGLLLLNPFLLDFFGIARGYGIALAFQLMSLYFIVLFFKDSRPKNAFVAIGISALAVLSNFSFLNYWLAVVLVINANSFAFKKYDFKKVFGYSAIVTVILIAIIYEPVRKLKKTGNLYYGGNENFYSDTLISLTKYTFYKPATEPIMVYALNIFVFLVVASVLTSFLFNRASLSLRNIFLFILFACISTVILQHYLLGTLYLIDRTALFFYPLFIFVLCFSVNDFFNKWYSKLILPVVAAFGLNFFMHLNLYKTAIWYFDADSPEILNWLDKKGIESNQILKIDFSWPFQNSFSYYFESGKYPHLEMVKSRKNRDDFNAKADYYIYLNQSLEKVDYESNNQKILSCNKKVVKQYKNENIIIYQNLQKESY